MAWAFSFYILETLCVIIMKSHFQKSDGRLCLTGAKFRPREKNMVYNERSVTKHDNDF